MLAESAGYWGKRTPYCQIIGIPVLLAETARLAPEGAPCWIPDLLYDAQRRRFEFDGKCEIVVASDGHDKTALSSFAARRCPFRPNLEDQALQVLVRDNNIDQAMRVLKKKLQREGVFREMKRRRFYEKPSEKSTREKAEAIRRSRKLARKQAIREGLIAAPKKKPLAPRRSPGGAPFGAPTLR